MGKNNLEKAKEVITKHINEAYCGIYDTRNIVGDNMQTIYNKNGLKIDICYSWKYYEVFGLPRDEFEELKKHYDAIAGW